MLTLWNDPWPAPRRARGLRDLRREMDRVFDDFDRALGVTRAGGVAHELALRETEDALEVTLDVPGFAEDDVEITLDERALTIRGQRRNELPEGASVHRRERGALAFARAVTLPCRVQSADVEARMSRGVLTLTLPKAPEERPRAVRVNVN